MWTYNGSFIQQSKMSEGTLVSIDSSSKRPKGLLPALLPVLEIAPYFASVLVRLSSLSTVQALRDHVGDLTVWQGYQGTAAPKEGAGDVCAYIFSCRGLASASSAEEGI